jgi:hypothetical protein
MSPTMIAHLRSVPLPMRMRYGTLIVVLVIITVYCLSVPYNESAASSWIAELQSHLPSPLHFKESDRSILKRPHKASKSKPSTSKVHAASTRTKLVYKPTPPPSTPIKDPWPLLSDPHAKRLVVPAINRPPRWHIKEPTPLFIGFTRNWPQLLQCVASYIAAGWPPEDILVVENTGVMYANRDGKLGLQNPFFLNHTQLGILGVKVLVVRTI